MGGKNARMGVPKWTLTLGGKSILDHILSRFNEHAASIVLNGHFNEPEKYAYPIIEDSIGDHQGPLAGLLSGLEYAKQQGKTWVITCPCDTPFLPQDFVPKLLDKIEPESLCAISNSYGKKHPVCGLWSIDLIEHLQHILIKTNRRSIGWWADQLNPSPTYVDFSDENTTNIDPFMNINTPEDWDNAQALYNSRI